MKITYAITVKDEFVEIQRLVAFLLEHKRPKDNIVVLFDQQNGSEEIAAWLTKKNILPNFQFWRGWFHGHFAEWKNDLKSYCDGDYIFQIDADEIPNEALIKNLPEILESNPDTDVYLVPRVNTVEGLTSEHISKWRWKLNDKNWINWPDYQWRIWKNKPEIVWRNKVHEVLEGYSTYSSLPPDEQFALYHPKTIERQKKQNAYYLTL